MNDHIYWQRSKHWRVLWYRVSARQAQRRHAGEFTDARASLQNHVFRPRGQQSLSERLITRYKRSSAYNYIIDLLTPNTRFRWKEKWREKITTPRSGLSWLITFVQPSVGKLYESRHNFYLPAYVNFPINHFQTQPSFHVYPWYSLSSFFL